MELVDRYDSAVTAKIAPGLAEALRREREFRGLSQAELARRSTVDASHLSDLEGAKRNPNMETVEKLARGLSVPMSALIMEAERLMAAQPATYISRAAALARCPGGPAGDALKATLAGLPEEEYLFGVDEALGYPYAIARRLIEEQS